MAHPPPQITSLFGNRVMEVLFIDFGATATIEVTELREIPASSVNDFYVVPPQVSCVYVCECQIINE